MDFMKLVTERESIRNYDPKRPVEREILEQILEAGRLAPSAANLQPWKFLLVSSEHILEQVRSVYPRAWFVEAPHILIVTGNEQLAWHRADGYNSIETDLTIAMDHMILAAENAGVGTCWVGNFDYVALRNILQLTDDEVVFAMTPLGYTKSGFTKKMQKSRKSFDEVVRFI